MIFLLKEQFRNFIGTRNFIGAVGEIKKISPQLETECDLLIGQIKEVASNGFLSPNEEITRQDVLRLYKKATS